MIRVEICLTVLSIVAAAIFPNRLARLRGVVAPILGPIAKRRTLSLILVGLLAVIARLSVLPIVPIPSPAVHDEFSYLLMADTFSHGRLANAPHQLWKHFETFHEIQQPTYVSIYYPAQGIILAIGQVLFGNPFWGVVFSAALMCVAICWAVQEWVSPVWGLLAGILAVIRLVIFNYWANSYWGGAVAATGGALAIGAVLRLKRERRYQDALLLALGLAVLFTSRPYEAVFFAIPTLVFSVFWLSRRRPSDSRRGRSPWRLALVFALVGVVSLSMLGYYFWRTTGSAVRSPYQVDLATYVPASLFIIGSDHQIPQYNHAVMRACYVETQLGQRAAVRSQLGWIEVARFLSLGFFFLGASLSLLFLFAFAAAPPELGFKDICADTKLLLGIVACTFVGMIFPVYYFPHYAAPITAVIYILVAKLLRFLGEWRVLNRRLGLAIVVAAILSNFALVPARIAAQYLKISPPPFLTTWDSPSMELRARQQIAEQLRREDASSLAIVKYRPEHDVAKEWVFNDADIDLQKVVWARDMGPEKNQELLDYYKDRKVWLVEPDENPVRIRPYPVSGADANPPSPHP